MQLPFKDLVFNYVAKSLLDLYLAASDLIRFLVNSVCYRNG